MFTASTLLGVLLSACDTDLEQLGATCDDGEVVACTTLGWMQLTGLGAPKDKKAGRLRYEKACALGDAASCGMAGDLHYAKRDKKARRFLTKACGLEHAGSCVDLGWMWAHGEGGATDLDTALDYYRRGCEGGAAGGCVMLGLHHRDTTGDRDRARRHFARACRLGDEIACEAAAKGGR